MFFTSGPEIFDKIINDASDRRSRKAVSIIICRIAFDNDEFTDKILRLIQNNLLTKSYIEAGPFKTLLRKFTQIKDKLY